MKCRNCNSKHTTIHCGNCNSRNLEAETASEIWYAVLLIPFLISTTTAMVLGFYVVGLFQTTIEKANWIQAAVVSVVTYIVLKAGIYLGKKSV